jgi:hypothetical protein
LFSGLLVELYCLAIVFGYTLAFFTMDGEVVLGRRHALRGSLLIPPHSSDVVHRYPAATFAVDQAEEILRFRTPVFSIGFNLSKLAFRCHTFVSG